MFRIGSGRFGFLKNTFKGITTCKENQEEVEREIN